LLREEILIEVDSSRLLTEEGLIDIGGLGDNRLLGALGHL